MLSLDTHTNTHKHTHTMHAVSINITFQHQFNVQTENVKLSLITLSFGLQMLYHCCTQHKPSLCLGSRSILMYLKLNGRLAKIVMNSDWKPSHHRSSECLAFYLHWENAQFFRKIFEMNILTYQHWRKTRGEENVNITSIFFCSPIYVVRFTEKDSFQKFYHSILHHSCFYFQEFDTFHSNKSLKAWRKNTKRKKKDQNNTVHVEPSGFLFQCDCCCWCCCFHLPQTFYKHITIVFRYG